MMGCSKEGSNGLADTEVFRWKPSAVDASRRGSGRLPREPNAPGDAKRLQPKASTGTLQCPLVWDSALLRAFVHRDELQVARSDINRRRADQPLVL